MTKVKLYVIADADGTVYAISEEEKTIYKYYKKRNFNKKNHLVITIRKKSLVNSMLRDMESLYLIHDDLTNSVMTNTESEIIEDLVKTELYHVRDIRKRLERLITRFNLSDSELKSFNKTIRILKLIETEDGELEEKLNVDGIMGGIDDIGSLMKVIHSSIENTQTFKDKVYGGL